MALFTKPRPTPIPGEVDHDFPDGYDDSQSEWFIPISLRDYYRPVRDEDTLARGMTAPGQLGSFVSGDADRWPSEHDGLVFRSEAGTPLEAHNTRRFLRTLARRAGLEGTVTPYDLRHTTTTRLSAKGVPPELLADLLGHKDTRMVFAHYRHPVTPVVNVAVEHFAEAFDR